MSTCVLQGVPVYYEFLDLEKIILCKIRNSGHYIANFHYYEFYYTAIPLVQILHIPIPLKFVQVEIVLVETILAGDPLYISKLRVDKTPMSLYAPKGMPSTTGL